MSAVRRAWPLAALLALGSCAPIPPARPSASADRAASPRQPSQAPLSGRCAAEAAITRKLAETIAETEPAASPPADPADPPRTRLRQLEDRVRQLKRRIARAAAPLDLQIRLKSGLPPTYLIESIRIWLDDQPVFAGEAGERAVQAHVAPGEHHVLVSAVLRGNFKGGLYDSVGFCFVTSSGYGFVAALPGAPAPRRPIDLDALLEEADPNAIFSARPRLRFAGAPPAPSRYRDDYEEGRYEIEGRL